ncbi:MAG: enoyl-CoA hydratase [Gammaproteobacteria bacterium]|nr:enoyl-CoA hydratase [Gammaproteobacteria bacterium]
MASDKILVEASGGIGKITFNNPAKLNAVSMEMWSAVDEALTTFEAQGDVRVLILTGAGGKAFVSGADISKFESERASKDAQAAYAAQTKQVYDRIETFPKPTIALINGYCIGGGLNLAMVCDIRICSEKSRFALPAAKLGIGYGYDALRRLMAVMGPGATRDICFSARQLSAGEAYARRIVDQVLPEEALDSAAMDYAARIAGNAPLTLAAMKFITAELLKNPDDRDMARCAELAEACFNSGDFIEGRRAFMEKRKPAFTGT